MPTTLITGASSGLGAEMARQLAARGWDLALAARRTERLEGLRDEIVAAHPGRPVELRALDVTDDDEVFEVFGAFQLKVSPNIALLFCLGSVRIAVFRLDTATGHLARQGVFYMSSNDYYSSSNYATRLIGDNLVIYTPFQRRRHDPATFKWPVVRRWRSDDERQVDIDRRSRPLFDAAEIYRPVRAGRGSDRPHRLGLPAGRGRLGARPRMPHHRLHRPEHVAMVRDRERRLPVDGSRATIIPTIRRPATAPPTFEESYEPALLYRVPVDGAAPGLVGARGLPPDQFSLQASGGRFHALLKDRPRYCNNERSTEARLTYLDFPLASFGATVRDVAPDRYTPLPGVKSHFIANRFTDRYLVYGSLGRYRRGLSEFAMPPAYVGADRSAAGGAPARRAPHRGPRRAGRQRHRADRLSRRGRAVRHPDRPRRAAAHRLVGAARGSATRARAAATPSTA